MDLDRIAAEVAGLAGRADAKGLVASRLATMEPAAAALALERIRGDRVFAVSWTSTLADRESVPEDDFAFAYVNWLGVDGSRRVRGTGLHFLPNGTLALATKSLFDGLDRLFVASLISRPGRPPQEGAFAFAYGGVDWDVPSGCGLRFGSTRWHPREQLLYNAFDLDKSKAREFAVADMRDPRRPSRGGDDGSDSAEQRRRGTS